MNKNSEISESLGRFNKKEETLSEFAFRTSDTKGRLEPLESDGIRNDFQRDRDRILHSKAFRRLTHKTQVFFDPEGDHYRTRLTHTLEVTQIGRTLARALRLNEDLTEAGCLGHDLGHTPFGHSGEEVLNSLLKNGFRHNEQSLRVVEKTERNYTGLNLTVEVRNAILCHTGKREADTLEGRLIKYADRIAYINHDIDDAARAGILTFEELPEEYTAVLGRTHSERIDTMVRNVIEFSFGKNFIGMDEKIQKATDGLRAFLFERVYKDKRTKTEEKRAKDMIEFLYSRFMKNPCEMPEEYVRVSESEGKEQAVCDYITGMTDRYAINIFCEIYVPKTWHIM